MIYSVVITSVAFPEPLFERHPGRIERSIDPAYLSAMIQQVGKGKLKFMVIDEKFYASFYQEGDYLGIVIHDGDYEGADNIGNALKEYFKQLNAEGRLPEAEEALRIVAYAMLPKPEEIQELLNILKKIEREHFVKPEHVFERVSLFTAISSTIKQTIKRIPKEEIMEAFYNADRKKVLEHAIPLLEDEDVKKAFIKTALLCYASPPSFPIIDPDFLSKTIEKVEDEVVAEFFRRLLAYMIEEGSFGDIIDFAAKYKEEILKRVSNPIDAAVFAFPLGDVEIYTAAANSLPEGSFFREMYESLITIGEGLNRSLKKDRENAIKAIERARSRMKECIIEQDFKALPHRLYAYVFMEYTFLSNVSRDLKENIKYAMRISSTIPAALNPMMSSEDVPALSYTRVYPGIYDMNVLALMMEYYNLFDPVFLKNILSIYKESIDEYIENFKKYVSSGRVPIEQLAHVVASLPVSLYFISAFIPELKEVAIKLAKTYSEINIERMRSVYEYISTRIVARHIRVSVSICTAVLALLAYGEIYVDKELLEKVINVLERVIIYLSIDTMFPDKISPSLAIIALLRKVYQDKHVPLEDKISLKLDTLKRLIYRMDMPPIGKILAFAELYKALKVLGSLSDELVEVINNRRDYIEMVGGDPNIIEKIS